MRCICFDHGIGRALHRTNEAHVTDFSAVCNALSNDWVGYGLVYQKMVTQAPTYASFGLTSLASNYRCFSRRILDRAGNPFDLLG